MSLPKINLVVIGHKDHGKSTLIGRLLYDSNAIPEQKLQEIESELEKSGKEEFKFAFLVDSLEEERIGGERARDTSWTALMGLFKKIFKRC